MGGEAGVESRVGHGSAFWFTARLQRGARKEVHPRAKERFSRHEALALSVQGVRRVLLAEDNVVNQRVAVGLLRKRGHHVTVANNGREALEWFDRETFDVALMDVQMPEMDGFEATAAIRARETTTGGHQRIIAMTANAMTGDRDRCLRAGMDGYVSKPLDGRLLCAVVEQRETAPNRQPRAFERPERLKEAV